MYHIAICDDKKEERDELEKVLQKESFLLGKQCEIVSCQNGTELLEKMENIHIDGVFLDIELPEMDGFMVASRLMEKGNPVLCFVSAKNELVYDSFRYRPLRFVRKIKLEADVKEALPFVYMEIQKLGKKLQLKDGNHTFEIYLNEIFYIDCSKNYLNIYMKEESVEIRTTMEKLEEEVFGLLQAHRLIKINRGCLVNTDYVSRIEQRDIIMVNGIRLPISRRMMAKVKENYLKSKR